MNIIEQVQFRAEQIADREGTWDCSAPLCALYASALEEMFTRIQSVYGDLDPDTVITLFQPMGGGR